MEDITLSEEDNQSIVRGFMDQFLPYFEEHTKVPETAQLAPVLEAQAEQPAIKVGDRVIITYKDGSLPHSEYHGVVQKIDKIGTSFCYLVKLDDHPFTNYYSESSYQIRLEVQEAPTEVAQPRKRGPKSTEPTQKRDFRFPVRLLEALKAASEEDGQTMTEFLMSLLKSDKRIQRKLENVMTEECEV